MAPELGVLLAQPEKVAHGDHLLPEDKVVASLPQLPAAEEDEARVVGRRDRRRPGQVVELMHRLPCR